MKKNMSQQGTYLSEKQMKQALEFYRTVINESFIKEIHSSLGLVRRSTVFNSSVGLWLMILQRLQPNKTLAGAVELLKPGGVSELFDESGKHIQVGKISGSTGGYSQARQREPLKLVEQVSDRLTKSIVSTHKKSTVENLKTYIVDGSTIRLNYSQGNLKKYPQYQNQHGKAHYPLMRIMVATDAVTGVVERPSYGAYSGDEATSELALVEDLLPRLEPGSLVIGDRYFGCTRFATAAVKSGLHVIARVKEVNVKKFTGVIGDKQGEKEIQWDSNRSTTGTPHSVKGRLVWFTLKQKGLRPIKLVLFTTLSLPIRKIVELYGLWWNVELDIRNMKSTLEMDFIDAKSPEMVAKELILGVAAYNLVRHFMLASSKKLKLTPRDLSFARALLRVNIIGTSPHEDSKVKEYYLNNLLADAKSLQLPKRKTPRVPEPRKVWPRGQVSTMSNSRESERKKILDSYSTSNISKMELN